MKTLILCPLYLSQVAGLNVFYELVWGISKGFKSLEFITNNFKVLKF